MKRSKFSLAVVMALVTALALIASPVMAKTIKVQQCYSSELPVLGTSMTWISETLKEATDGDLTLKIYEPGKLVKGFEALDAVSRGQVDAGFCAAGFWAGKLPAAPIFSSLPFGPEADEYMAWMFYGNGLKLAQQMYDEAGYDVVTIPAAILVPETSGWFTKPIESVDDLKGLKMRFYGYGGDVMQRLGMSVTLMPAGELFPALEKKVIDATEFSMPTIDHRLGFYKIAKYNYYPGWHQQATFIDLIVSKKTWDKLTPGQQKMIRMACMAGITNSIAEGESSQGPVIRENAESRGVNNMYWSPEMLDTFRTNWEAVAVELKSKDAYFAKVYDDLMAFRKEYAFWQSNGFLPRGCK